MTPRIRSATPAAADFAAPLLQATTGATGHTLRGESSDEGAARAIAAFFQQPGNRLSFLNTLMLEEGGERLGLAVLYPGEAANALDEDEPFRTRLRALGLPSRLDPEATPGELYLDTLAVALGLPLGLLVEEGNPAARLYARHGFVPAGPGKRGHAAGHLA